MDSHQPIASQKRLKSQGDGQRLNAPDVGGGPSAHELGDDLSDSSLRFWKEEDLGKDCSALSFMDKKRSKQSAPVKTTLWHGGNRPLTFFT